MRTRFQELCWIFVSFLSLIHGKVADQKKHSACPINHNPTFFCCDHLNGEKYVFTLFSRPNGAGYGEAYRHGWYEMSRQVNYPSSRYSPRTSRFYYNDSSFQCHLRRILVGNEVHEKLHCGRSTGDPNLFMTYSLNPRNNNASCPIGANWTLITTQEQKEECTFNAVLNTPTLYSTFMELPFLLTYFMYLVGFFLGTLWFLYKTWVEKYGFSTIAPLQPDDYVQLHSCRVSTSSNSGHEPTTTTTTTTRTRFDRGIFFPSYGTESSTKEVRSINNRNSICQTPSENSYSTTRSSRIMGGGATTDALSLAAGPTTTTPTMSMKDRSLSNEMEEMRNRQSNISILHISDEEPRDMDVKSQFQIGYSSHPLGKFVFWYFTFLTVYLHVIIITVILDVNEMFNPPLFHLSDILKVFMSLFFIITLWFMILVIFHSKIHNFFRIQTSLDSCQYVEMFKPDESEILLVDNSGISKAIQRMERLLFPLRKYGHRETVKVEATLDHVHERFVEFEFVRYTYNSSLKYFIPGAIYLGNTYADILDQTNGLSSTTHQERWNVVGPNIVNVVMPSLNTSLAEEFFNFFYIYQTMCYYNSLYYKYYYVALPMIFIILCTAAINIYTKRKMQRKMLEMSKCHNDIRVYRDRSWKVVSSLNLVPGDYVQVQDNSIVCCDMILTSGSILCDESNLTGESIPVRKSAVCLNGKPEDCKIIAPNQYHELYAGTKTLSSDNNEEVFAVVRATGANTSRGRLIRNIAFPIPIRFKWDEHLKVIIAVSVLYAVVASYLTFGFLISNGDLELKLNIFGNIISIIGGTICPLLPVVVTVGQVTAAGRLEKMGVFSLIRKRLALCGKVRLFCFDKTGTLTMDGLSFLEFIPFCSKSMTFSKGTIRDLDLESLEFPTMMALASCHTLGSLEGTIVGNEVEVSMFLATKWKLIENPRNNPIIESPTGYQFEILKRFNFDRQSMSMSVVVKDLTRNKIFVFCKGSYESIQVRCTSETIGKEYLATAEAYAKNGYYVLGIAYKEWAISEEKEIEISQMSREALEKGLSFLGFVLFRNEIKKDAKDAITQLKDGDIRTIMITGDNAHCGYFVAKECGMLKEDSRILFGDLHYGDEVLWDNLADNERHNTSQVLFLIANNCNIELAITEKAFYHLQCTGDLFLLLFDIRIFSRMTPDAKVDCIRFLMEKGVITGMCGDGGNDCGALRMAHVGIALTNAEASLVAPFTSKSKSPMSVVDLCREGRCSVATSHASVKFLIMYSLAVSTVALISNFNGVGMGDWCWLMIDLGLTVGLSYTITRCQPLPFLGKQRPTSSLVGTTTVCSLLGQEVINASFIVIGLKYLASQVWYCPFGRENIDLSKWWLLGDNAITTCLFYCILFQLPTAAISFSLGGRFRQSIWRNSMLCIYSLLIYGIATYFVLGSPSRLTELFRIASSTNVVGLPDIPLPWDFRAKFYLLLIANMLTAFGFEKFVVLGPVRTFLRANLHKTLPLLKV